MSRLASYILPIVLSLLSLHASAQDKVYGKNKKVDDWTLTEITPGYIKGKQLQQNGATISSSPGNVLFAFNAKGNYIVIANLFKQADAERYVKNFFAEADTNFRSEDKIITLDNALVQCRVDMEDDNYVEYSAGNKRLKLAKAEIAVIIYKDGHHLLLVPHERAFKVLRATEKQYNDLAFAGAAGAKETANTATAVTAVEPSPGTATPADTVAIKTPNAVDKAAAAELDAASLAKLQQKALINIAELGTYIQLICSRNSDPDKVSKTVDQALTLFANEDARFEVSSLSRNDVRQYPVRVYLNRMAALKYDKVLIEWYNVQYASKLRKGADGFYYGIIEFEQRFTGYLGDKRLYQDITRKTVEIVLKTYTVNRHGQSTLEWDVFLGNIGVTVTKSTATT